MSVVLQISDTHFGTEQPPVVEALVRLAIEQQPDVVLLSGDITQRARPAQFRAARAFVDRLGAKVMAVPGNHDIPLFDLWARAICPYARYIAAFGTELEPVHASADLLIIGVNTTRAWRHKHGEVDSAQIARVAEVLGRASPTQLRVVMVHQPVAVIRREDRSNLLRGHAAALQAWSAAGADLVVGGHIHLPYMLPVEGRERRLWVLQAGTAVSARIRSGTANSIHILRWHAPSDSAQAAVSARKARLVIEQWDFASPQQAFVPVKVNTITPDRHSA
jgi:predicted phosphodiesterase